VSDLIVPSARAGVDACLGQQSFKVDLVERLRDGRHKGALSASAGGSLLLWLEGRVHILLLLLLLQLLLLFVLLMLERRPVGLEAVGLDHRDP